MGGLPKENQEFLDSEWEQIDHEIFGKPYRKERFDLVAKENDNIVGIARGYVLGGVAVLSQLMVEKSLRKQRGIGSRLLKDFEEVAQAKNASKIRLFTSEKHNVISFYEKHGYHISATLNKDLFGAKWFFFEKFLVEKAM